MSTLIATRVMKARHESICPQCRTCIGVGNRIGLVLTIGWCHIECVIGRAA
jgi:hypothetical protein